MESALLSGRLDCTCGIQIDGVTVGCGAVVDCSAFGFPAASILSDAATIPSYEVAAKATAVFTFKSEGGKETKLVAQLQPALGFHSVLSRSRLPQTGDITLSYTFCALSEEGAQKVHQKCTPIILRKDEKASPSGSAVAVSCVLGEQRVTHTQPRCFHAALL